MLRVRTGKQFSGTMDMAFAGTAMLKNPKMINEWSKNLFANDFPFTWGLLQMLGDEVDEQVTDSGIYRIGSCGINNRTVYITSYTGTPKIGHFIHVTLTDGWMKHGATGELGDGRTMMRLDDDGISQPDGRTTYRAQLIGNNPDEVCPDHLLQGGAPFNFGTAIYGEASKTGHPVNWQTGDVHVNTMTTVRTKVSWTGDFLSEGMEIEVSKSGDKAPFLAFLPGSVGFYKEHMRRVDYWNLHGVANFDPISGKIFTQTKSDEKGDVLAGSGLYDIMEKCAIPMAYKPQDVLAGRREMSPILDEAISIAARYTGEEFIGMVAIGGQIAMKCVEKASQEKLIRENISLELMLDGTKKEISTKGLYFKYQSTFGEVQVMWNKYVDNPNKQYLQQYTIQNQGMQYALRSGDLLIIPIIKYRDPETGKMKPSLSLFSKGKSQNGMAINRKLVFGFFRGMTGLTNSVSGSGASTFLKQFKEYTASSAQDADQAELLSQTMLIVRNADKCVYLRAIK